MNESATDSSTLALADDRGTGVVMFVTFTVACLIVTGAVAMLALIDTWWVLGLAFGIHVIMTAVVGVTVLTALDDGALAPAGRARRDAAQGLDVRSGARVEGGRAHAAAA
jgi:membrane protein implicated in regulation of membrane protease activity